MSESSTETIATAGSIRPVMILDAWAFERNSIFLEHFFVALADQSVHTAVVCPPESDTSLTFSPMVEIITHPACRIPLFWRENRRRLMKSIERFGPTVLHCIPRERIGLTRKIAHRFGLPYILTARGMDTFRAADIADPLCAGIIVSCASIRDYIAKTYPNVVSRIEQIEVGAFVDDATACFAKPQRMPSMIVVRPLENARDFEPLFNAVKHLTIDNYEFVLVMIGEGKADSAIRKMIRAMGLSQVVNIVPNFHKLRAAFAEADICIRPRPVYAFSVPLLEAMSVGMVIAACDGGVDDLIIEDETAVLFNPEDHLSIYSTLKRLLDDRVGARRIAISAQAYLRQHHTVSKMMSGLIGAYARAASKKSSVETR